MYTFFLTLNYCISENIFRFVSMSVREVRLAESLRKWSDSPGLRWATADDRVMLIRAGYDEGSLQRRFAASCRAVIYEENGELIVACWYAPLAMEQWEEYQVSLDFPTTGTWNFDLWVLPSHRGRGIAGKMLGFGNAALYAEGYRSVYGVIVGMNKNSLRANEKAGSREIGHFLFVRLINFAYFRAADTIHFGRFEKGKKFAVPLRISFPTEE
jgi:GNAT superfamily N-acetyltransferase